MQGNLIGWAADWSPLVLIYGLRDPRDGQLRYVGKTKRAPRVRHREYETLNSHPRWLPVWGWCRELRLAGMSPEMVELEWVEESVATAAERHWIDHVRRRCNLLNIQYMPRTA